jgi:hypothetical protein
MGHGLLSVRAESASSQERLSNKTAEIEAFFFAASSTFFFTASRYAKPERREVCRPLNVGRRILAGPAAVRQALVEQRK